MKQKLERISGKLIEAKFNALKFYKKLRINIGDQTNVMRLKFKGLSDFDDIDTYGTLLVLHDLEKVVTEKKLYDFDGNFISKNSFEIFDLVKKSKKLEVFVLSSELMDVSY